MSILRLLGIRPSADKRQMEPCTSPGVAPLDWWTDPTDYMVYVWDAVGTEDVSCFDNLRYELAASLILKMALNADQLDFKEMLHPALSQRPSSTELLASLECRDLAATLIEEYGSLVESRYEVCKDVLIERVSRLADNLASEDPCEVASSAVDEYIKPAVVCNAAMIRVYEECLSLHREILEQVISTKRTGHPIEILASAFSQIAPVNQGTNLGRCQTMFREIAEDDYPLAILTCQKGLSLFEKELSQVMDLHAQATLLESEDTPKLVKHQVLSYLVLA